MLASESTTRDVNLPAADGAGLNWIYENCEVLARGEASEDSLIPLQVRVPAVKRDQFEKRFGRLTAKARA